MALSRTTLVGEISIDGHGSGAFTTSSFTPPSNSLIVVCAGGMDPVGAVGFDDALTMAGGGWTYTSRVSEETGAGVFNIAVNIWTAPVTTGASMTLSLDAGARSLQFGAISAVAYTGYDTGSSPTGGTGVVIDTVSPDGVQSITLSGAPATDSEVFAGITMDKENAGVVPGSGFTEIHDLQVGSTGGIETEVRTGSTSTTVDWVDTWPGGGNIFKIVAAAVEIKAAAGGGGFAGLFVQPIQSGRRWC